MGTSGNTPAAPPAPPPAPAPAPTPTKVLQLPLGTKVDENTGELVLQRSPAKPLKKGKGMIKIKSLNGLPNPAVDPPPIPPPPAATPPPAKPPTLTINLVGEQKLPTQTRAEKNSR